MLRIRSSSAPLPDGRTMSSRWLDNTDEAFFATLWADSAVAPPTDLQADFRRRVARNRLAAELLQERWAETPRLAAGTELYISTIYLIGEARIGMTSITLTAEGARDLLVILPPAQRGKGNAERMLQLGAPLLYDLLGAPQLQADVLHSVTAARGLALKRGVLVEGAAVTPRGQQAHRIRQTASRSAAKPRLQVTTAWRTEPDSYPPFASPASPPAFTENLTPPPEPAEPPPSNPSTQDPPSA